MQPAPLHPSTSQQVGLGLIRTARSLLSIGLAICDGEEPTGLNPESLKIALAMMEGGPAPDVDMPEGSVPAVDEPVHEIDPAWFTGKNHHMTLSGKTECCRLWLDGVKASETARRMGTDVKPIRAWYKRFAAGVRY